MTDILSLDIETANYSYDIGGWNNRTLFEPSVIATWDGTNATIFTKKEITIKGAAILPLHAKDIGNHLTEHIEKGGKILGLSLIHI